MKNIKRCCFAGHSDVRDIRLEGIIKEVAENLILNHNVTEFWVGNYGNFDSYVSSAIRKLKKIYTHIKLELIIPYVTKDINEYKALYLEKYDSILIADIPENTPRRFHITKANEYMVNNSDFLICYIQKSWGGAMTTYKYAKRKNLKILNIAEETPLEIL